MPIRIPDALPATAALESENIFVMTERRALHQDIRPLRVLILNLMPTKIATETQIMRKLSNTPLQGIPKQTRTEKLSGVYEHHLEKPSCPLVRGVDDRFWAVHSRYTGVDEEAVHAHPELEVIAASDEAGLYIVKSTDSKRFFVFGHPEYDADTLKFEYERDVKAGIDPDVPVHYFPNDDPSREPLCSWRAQAQLIYSNWLNYYVYQTTPYDVMHAGE